jgi:putative membrane protein
MNGNGYGMGGGGTWVFAIVLLLGLGLLVLLAVRWFGESRTRTDVPAAGKTLGPSAARGILDERLARGELSPTEYRDRLETLHESP